MSRKYLYGMLVGIGLSSPLAAESVPFSGFFVNGDLGYSMAGVSYTETLITPTGSMDSGKTKINTSGIVGAIGGGMGHTFSNKFHLGGLIQGGLSGVKGDYKTTGAQVCNEIKLKMTNFFDVHVCPGYVIGKETPALLHFIVGLESSKWKASISSSTRRNGRPTTNEATSLNKRLMGFTYGIGTKILVSPVLAVGLKVTHTNYKALPQGEHVKAAPNKLTYSVKPQENRAMISLTKFFNS